MIDFECFKKLFYSIIGETEFELFFDNTDDTYMLIKYDDFVTFQKCCDSENRGEIIFPTLDELYNSTLLDNICLMNDWDKLCDITIDATWSVVDDKEEIKEIFNITV